MQVLCFLRSSRLVLKILKPIHVTEHSKLTQMPPDVCWVCFGKLLPYAQLCGAITVSKFRLFKWNTLGRISPHLTASTLTRLTAPQHLSPTQPSQAPNIKAWLPTAAHSCTAARHPVISLPCPQRTHRLPLNLQSKCKGFTVPKGPAWSGLWLFPHHVSCLSIASPSSLCTC